MLTLRKTIGLAVVLAAFASAANGIGSVSAADGAPYPANPIRIVVPTGPGTPPDIIARVVAPERSQAEGWKMFVENRPGAMQTIGRQAVLNPPADGYSIYPMSVPTAAVPKLMPKLGL